MEAAVCEEFPDFDSDSRLLLIAAHPDDETLGCGVVLQRAVRAGAAIQVVYVTDGDNNPWPQRFIERRWRLNTNDRKRWATLRRAEALDALRLLGVRASNASFLALPDQGLTDLLRHGGRSTLERFARIIRNWSPTHLLVPSVADTHPDHNALAVILRLMLAEFFSENLQMSVWTYAIHGKNRAFFQRSQQIRQSEAETKTKTRAICCHKTQVKLSRRRFLAYATRPERLVRLSRCEPPLIEGSIRSITKKSRTLHLGLQFPLRPFGIRTPRLFLFGYAPGETLRCIAIQIAARTALVEIRDVASGDCLGTAEYRGNVFGGELTIPPGIFSLTQRLFIKVERRRYWFFDEAGWLEIAPEFSSPPVTLNAPQAQFIYSDSVPAKMPMRAAGSAQAPWRWAFLFVVVLVWLATVLSADIDRPWINAVDYNGAVWSQSAHNILRAGLADTLGASSGFYFGPLPIPVWGYYLHHPPLLHLAVTALFAAFGEHEWVARLLPITCSLASVVLLWFLVRSCAGTRGATLSAAVFACLPMALRYGQMVNFEPCVLMLILGEILCLRYWTVSGKARWRHAALGLILVGLWVDWAMYIFVASLSICWLSRSRETRSFAKVLILAALFSAACYFVRIQLLRPDASQNLAHTLVVRLGYSGMAQFTELQWLERVLGSLVVHFLPLGWVLAAAGALATFRARRHDKDLFWLFRVCVCVFVMDAFFVGVFQNDSYIHQYLSFYFLAPVAIMAGIALDRLITFFQINFNARKFALVGELLACAIVVAMGTHGMFQTRELQQQFRILDYRTPEPPNLIPELGAAIREDFPPGTRVLCNFLPQYGPQLAYYAQREILNNLSDYRSWRRYLSDSGNPVGGVVWMAPKSSRDLIANLPRGSQRFLRVGNLSFCLWKRNQAVAKGRLTGALN
jgi:LmbE family N-acetylglucosaminyl deacetylase/4-amino-4-deoxy-L-arabinose transferase-like glycosyltransferase